MGCAASKSVLSAMESENSRTERNANYSVSSKAVSLEASLPSYWEKQTSIKISKEGKENIRNVAQELGI